MTRCATATATPSLIWATGFDAAARAYVAAHPSTDSNLRWFGAAFADWLFKACPNDPDIGELASLDGALRRAFDAADAPVLGLDELAALPAEDWARVGLEFQ
ncbi:MAG: putative DNA-binding domain-containing protein, partial [Methylibium sp.]